MKTKYTLLRATLLAALASTPVALQAADSENRWEKAPHAADRALAEMYPHGQRGSDVIGMPVRSATGATLGRISNLVIDTRTGEIVFAVVSTGGVLGIGDTQRAVPFSALRLSQETRAGAELDIDEARWTSAPKFHAEELSTLSNERSAADIHTYYSSDPARITRPRGDNDNAGARRELALSSWLRGKELRSGDQALGEVEDVVVQLDKRQAALLLDPSDTVSAGNDRYVVPVNQIAVSRMDDGALTTQLAPERLRSADDLSNDRWTDREHTSVYRWAPVIDREGSSRDRASERALRENEPAPVEIVRRALQTDDRLRDEADNVDVVARGDRVILRGSVPTDELKERFEEKAESAAGGWRVDNQLQVEPRR